MTDTATQSPRIAPGWRSDAARWEATRTRDRNADGAFWIGVLTTGIYCRPGCPARTPKRENVRFFDSPEAARAAGLRPCKRCRPDGPSPADARDSAIARACRLIETAETLPTQDRLAEAAGLAPAAFARAFRERLGITPRQYATAWRDGRLKEALARAGSVTEAIYEAGFNAPSRAYEAAAPRLGMAPAAARRRGRGEEIRYGLATGWLGRTLVAATQRGLCSIQLGDDDAALIGALRERFPDATLEPAEPGSAYQDWIDRALDVIERPDRAGTLPLDIQGTAFQEQVWRALQAIPAGETRTYSELAEAIGRPTATRAVAAACGANRLAILIPCHRVIGKDGSLTGYRWGTERKEKLLAREAGAGSSP